MTEKNMEKDIEVFLQTRPTTCGVASLMMILNFFKCPIRLTKGEEGDIFRDLKMKLTSFVPAMNLAWFAKEKMSCEVCVLIEYGRVDFWELMRSMGQEFYEGQQLAYKRAKNSGVNLVHKDIKLDDLDQYFNNGYLLLCNIQLDENTKHAIVLFDSEGDFYKIADPLSGISKIRKETLLNKMRLDVGTIFIAIKK